MRRPPLLITPPHLTDLPSLATLHQLAFWPSHFFQQMFDSATHQVRPSDWEAWHLRRLERWAEEGEKGGQVIAVAKRGETVLGYGHSTVHDNGHGEEEGGEEDEWPVGTDVEAARSVFGGMEAVESLIPGKFVVLHQLATDPLHQKTGAGRALLRWFIDKARSMGFDDLYLQATPAGQHLYDSMGFKQFAPTIVSVRGVEIYPMVHCFRE
ncbi:acyl-CoA N-acyltransferase [Leucosporidium creatinivorum]|uniref:Acyl-CoA N-acyltransferase n=1 Tax=Leucosporidium creatinivorum TaxID=106004 RepID=A0A1Y2E9Y6_9BASI|nr:acyl-CoA N-acyltransferase [Leucosporidium creatinivorum]